MKTKLLTPLTIALVLVPLVLGLTSCSPATEESAAPEPTATPEPAALPAGFLWHLTWLSD